MGKIVGIYDFFGDDISEDLFTMLKAVIHPSHKKIGLIIPPVQIEADDGTYPPKVSLEDLRGFSGNDSVFHLTYGRYIFKVGPDDLALAVDENH